jgi:hypothetical protein
MIWAWSHEALRFMLLPNYGAAFTMDLSDATWHYNDLACWMTLLCPNSFYLRNNVNFTFSPGPSDIWSIGMARFACFHFSAARTD